MEEDKNKQSSGQGNQGIDSNTLNLVLAAQKESIMAAIKTEIAAIRTVHEKPQDEAKGKDEPANQSYEQLQAAVTQMQNQRIEEQKQIKQMQAKDVVAKALSNVAIPDAVDMLTNIITSQVQDINGQWGIKGTRVDRGVQVPDQFISVQEIVEAEMQKRPGLDIRKNKPVFIPGAQMPGNSNPFLGQQQVQGQQQMQGLGAIDVTKLKGSDLVKNTKLADHIFDSDPALFKQIMSRR